ncbi:MAG: hypothetical protein K6E19_03610 [Lachnospiraceae bacterium]|nr:hypothetical protein [Lachnospiraceae bacterium]
MVFKKTFLSYFNMVLGAVFFGCLLFLSFDSFFEYAGLTGTLLDVIKLSYLPAAALIVLIVLIFVLISYIKRVLFDKGVKICIHGPAVRALTDVGFTVLIALGIYLLYDKCQYLLSKTYVVERLAGLTDTFGSPYNYTGDVTEHIYYLLTGFVFNVFGETPVVYLVLGTSLYFIAAVFVYFTVKSLLGGLSALTAFLSTFAYAYFYSDGKCLYAVKENIMFVITAFIIMLFALVLKLRHEGLMISTANLILFVILGLILGFVSGFYPGMLLLLVPECIMIALDDIDFTEADKEYEEPETFPINKPLVPIISVILATALGVLGFVLFNELVHGFSFEASLGEFVKQLTFHWFVIPDRDMFLYLVFGKYVAATIILGILSLFAFVNFFYVRRDRVSVYVLGILPLSLLFFFTDMFVNSGVYMFAFIVAIATCGVKALYEYEARPAKAETADIVDYIEKAEEQTEENSEVSGEKAEESEVVEAKTEDSEGTDIKAEESEGAEVKADDSESSDSSVESVEVSETVEPEVKPEPKPTPALFDVPITLPKKHEKKVISYDFDVPQYLMKYDVDTKEGDDFDI